MNMVRFSKKLKSLDPNVEKEIKEAKRLKKWADKEEEKLKKHKKELKAMLKDERREEKVQKAEEFDKEHSNPDELSRKLAYLEAMEERQE